MFELIIILRPVLWTGSTDILKRSSKEGFAQKSDITTSLINFHEHILGSMDTNYKGLENTKLTVFNIEWTFS